MSMSFYLGGVGQSQFPALPAFGYPMSISLYLLVKARASFQPCFWVTHFKLRGCSRTQIGKWGSKREVWMPSKTRAKLYTSRF